MRLNFLRVMIVSALLLAWLMSAVLVGAQPENGNAVPPAGISPVQEVALGSQDSGVAQSNGGNTVSVLVCCLPVGAVTRP